MNIRYSRIFSAVIVVLLVMTTVTCSDKAAEMPLENRDPGETASLQKSAGETSWGIVFIDAFNDSWYFNKHEDRGGFVRFRGEYLRYHKIFNTVGLYHKESGIFSIAVKYSINSQEYVMNETLKYYGDNKFYGKYAYAVYTHFDTDNFTITENSSGIVFKQSEIPPEGLPEDFFMLKSAGKNREKF